MNVDKKDIYVLPGWNKTFTYTIIKPNTEDRVETVRLKIGKDKVSDTLYKLEYPKGKNKTRIEYTGEGFDLHYLKGRTYISYNPDELKVTFNLTNIIEKDLGLKYRLEIIGGAMAIPYSNEVTLIKIGKCLFSFFPGR